MVSSNFDPNQDPLWSIPQSVQDRMQVGVESSDYRSFLLCGLYCGMAVLFLIMFGFYSITVGEDVHGVILFGFAGVTVAGYAVIWLGHWYAITRHFTTSMMGVLCLYLFYTGGLHNTGPLYYFVFPSVALFLHGRLRGFIWVIALLILTILLWHGLFDFDVDRYDSVLVTRVIAVCLIISMLACIPEYYRIQAERKLLLSISDLESLTYGDLRTKLANRALLEKMLLLEFNRNQRYGSACCLMFIELDPVAKTLHGLNGEMHTARRLVMLADILRRNLRVQDLAGRWENHCFLLVLPEISLDGARTLAERLLVEVRTRAAAIGILPLKITASIGIAALDKGPGQLVLDRAANGLIAAQHYGGNCCQIV